MNTYIMTLYFFLSHTIGHPTFELEHVIIRKL